jgi:predicted integral membrane protein DUF2269
VLYSWLLFVHVLSVGAFLFAHGVSGGASFMLRGPVTGTTRTLMRYSQMAGAVSNPAIILILITGVWMTIAGHWGSRVWPWLALGILIVSFAAMVFIARPYYMARDAGKGGSEEEVAAKLARTKPELAAAIGVVALVILFGLMVFKPF